MGQYKQTWQDWIENNYSDLIEQWFQENPVRFQEFEEWTMEQFDNANAERISAKAESEYETDKIVELNAKQEDIILEEGRDRDYEKKIGGNT